MTVALIRTILVCYGTFVHPQINPGNMTSIRTIEACYGTYVVTLYSDLIRTIVLCVMLHNFFSPVSFWP